MINDRDSVITDAELEYYRMQHAIAALRAENEALRASRARLESAAIDLHPWSRRYCDGRSTYAPAKHNEATRELLALGVKLPAPDGAPWARDPMGRAYDDLTDEEAAAVEAPSMGERTLWKRIADLEASRARLAAVVRYVSDRNWVADGHTGSRRPVDSLLAAEIGSLLPGDLA